MDTVEQMEKETIAGQWGELQSAWDKFKFEMAKVLGDFVLCILFALKRLGPEVNALESYRQIPKDSSNHKGDSR